MITRMTRTIYQLAEGDGDGRPHICLCGYEQTEWGHNSVSD